MEGWIMSDIRTSALGGIPFGGTAQRPASAANGQPYFNGDVGRLELYTSSTGWQNIVQETPGIASIAGAYDESAGQGTITISGTNFVSGGIAYAVGTNGVEYQATTSVTNSIVQMTALFTGLSAAYEPYDIKVTNPSNLFGLIPDALYINQTPVWTTAVGSLGTYSDNAPVSIQLSATDPESTSITYSLTSGALPAGISLSSGGLISGTGPIVTSNTTYNFTVTATDGQNASPRTFSMILNNVLDGATSARAANNAAAILSVKPSATSGTYWIKGYNNTPMQVYCDMTGSSAGSSTGGWMRFDETLVSTYRGTAINEELRRCTYVSPGKYQKNDVDGFLGGVRWDLGTSIAFTGVRQTSATLFSNNGADGYGFCDRLGTAFGGVAQGNPPRPSDAQQIAFINSDYNAGSNGTTHAWAAINNGLTQIHRYFLGYLGNGSQGSAGQFNPWGSEAVSAVVTSNTVMFHQSDAIGFSGRYLQWNESDGTSEWDRLETYTIWLK